jgi:hypothetical protein
MTIMYGVPRASCSLTIGGAPASMIAESLKFSSRVWCSDNFLILTFLKNYF